MAIISRDSDTPPWEWINPFVQAMAIAVGGGVFISLLSESNARVILIIVLLVPVRVGKGRKKFEGLYMLKPVKRPFDVTFQTSTDESHMHVLGVSVSWVSSNAFCGLSLEFAFSKTVSCFRIGRWWDKKYWAWG